MKKTLAALLAALALGVPAASAEGLFQANELSIMGFGNWIDKQEEHWGGGFGIGYFLTRNFGVGATTHWEDIEGTFLDNLAGEAYFRLPLNRIPIAPYAIGSASYSWELERWSFGAGGGAELRLNETIGLFSDIQWLFNEGAENDGVGVRFGFRLNM